MDIINNEVERGIISEKKPNKTQIMTLAIAGAGLIIVILLVLLLTGSSSSNQTYVEGKDYKVEYFSSNDISKEKLNSKLKEFSVFDYDNLMDTKNKNNSDFAPFDRVAVYYNKQLDWLIIDGARRPKPGMEGGPRMTTLSVWSLKDDKKIDYPGDVKDDYKSNAKIVYNWQNITK